MSVLTVLERPGYTYRKTQLSISDKKIQEEPGKTALELRQAE
jgi:hypothetical protein